MKNLVILFAIGFPMLHPCYLVAEERPPFSFAYELLLSDKQLSTSDRVSIAKGFSKLCGQINAKIPTLSPNEKLWIKGEVKAGRISSLSSSIEIAKQTTKEAFFTCSLYASVIVSAQSPINETAAWTVITREILTPYLSSRLERLNERNISAFSTSELATVSLFEDIAYRILEKIITPLVSSVEKTEK